MMTSRKKTASEFIAELQSDPAFRARQQQLERKRRETERALRQAEQPLVQALSSVGIEIESVWNLVNSATPYPRAIPILLDHLKRPYPDAVREGIARALAVPQAKCGWDLLKRLYQEEDGRRAKSGLAAAIAAVATDDVIEEVIALARSREHGSSRLLLLSALERSREPKARPASHALAIRR